MVGAAGGGTATVAFTGELALPSDVSTGGAATPTGALAYQQTQSVTINWAATSVFAVNLDLWRVGSAMSIGALLSTGASLGGGSGVSILNIATAVACE